MTLAGIRIAVERRKNGYFVGNIPVTFGNNPRYVIPPLSDETLQALGHRWDFNLRLRRCRACRALFLGHYSADLCSDNCVNANQVAWREAHRPLQRPPSKAAERRAALASATCHACGTRFRPQRLTARFCSGRCRQKHYRNTLPMKSPPLMIEPTSGAMNRT